ncbi:hypothetical protein CDAR_505731 [Caerostris darwini]|uniref:Secreted protein n=1 Tax=Caerostris darwini TaxID=1538125 RepID=A0AAV4W8D3_9ARAC|nr:hypothetical protein CDAR_113951 [Caerostris darwini]GIY79047.1 hypothetical protein CDAR_505731 [Caerostris darwini]
MGTILVLRLTICSINSAAWVFIKVHPVIETNEMRKALPPTLSAPPSPQPPPLRSNSCALCQLIHRSDLEANRSQTNTGSDGRLVFSLYFFVIKTRAICNLNA